MNSTEEDHNDKPHEATPRKLEDARKKGQIVRSQDTNTFIAVLIFFIAFSIFFNGSATDIVEAIKFFLAEQIERKAIASPDNLTKQLYSWVSIPLFFFFILPLIVITLGLVGARQIIFTSDNLKFKISRISIISNIKKRLGISGLFEFLKSTLKFGIFSIILAYFIISGIDMYLEEIILFSSNNAFLKLFHITQKWLIVMLAIYACIAILDIFWRTKSHAKKNRMSDKEIKDEHKNEEGDAQMKQKRRSKAEELATNRMLLDVPKSSVVITNPTHYAVALSWNGGTNSVPKCVARGTDETARKIREVAIESGVPLYRDPPTARELYATVKIGMFIDRDHYKAVAIAIGYARKIQKMVEDADGE
ncbi:flagellar biosynthesis protein FlhB [Marivita sp. S0852]|uniref:EscU/YscU/HrcU family type III secretion system export apparatus switch protein n=1 Tax=Marivita sp. S0852 TaxID=3373893 RepID=UPI0039829385